MAFDYNKVQQDIDKLFEVITDETRRRYDIFYNPTPRTISIKGLDASGNVTVKNVDNIAKVVKEITDWRNAFNGISGIDTNMTVTVGDGGDYPNLQAALKAVISKYRANEVNSIDIVLKSGYVLKNRIILNSGMNYGFIRIYGEDDQTTISSSDIGDHAAVYIGKNTISPVWDQLFIYDDNSNDAQDGFYVADTATVLMLGGSGVIGAGGAGLFATGNSRVQAARTNFSNCKGPGVSTTLRASVVLNGANLSGSGHSGLHAGGSSLVSVDLANLDNAVIAGIRLSENATVSAGGASAKNAGAQGVYMYGSSSLYANSIVLDGSGGDGILCIAGASANINNASIKNAGNNGINVAGNATVIASGAYIENVSNVGIAVSNSGDVSASNAVIKDTGAVSVRCEGSSRVHIPGATITNSGGAGIAAIAAAIINGEDTTIDTASGNGINCSGATSGYFHNVAIKNCDIAVSVIDNAKVSCHSAQIESCTTAVSVTGGGVVNANSVVADVSGDVIHAGTSAKIIAFNVNGKTSGSDSVVYFAADGAYVDARNPQGDNTTNIDVNSVTSKQAFILQ